MLKRIVKLSFKAGKTEEFVAIFKENSARIQAFPGCRHVELLRSVRHVDMYFTYSLWESEADLEAYRESAQFRQTWQRVKPLLAEKAAAWSLELVE